MSENEFHRISLVAYMCNLDSENAWKYFSKENPLFGKFDKAENEGVFLTNEGARFLVWQKKYPPHMEREWRGINIQGANAAKSLFEQEEWHLSPKSIANKLQYEMHKSIAIDTWGLYLLAVEEKLDLLERFDQIYVTHFSVSRMLEEITHFKNENMEVILAYLESAEHVKLQSPNFEVQLKVRENVNYYEPCSTIAMAVEAEIPAIIGETMLAQNLIDRFKNYIVRPDELEEMMGIACNSCFVREYQNNKERYFHLYHSISKESTERIEIENRINQMTQYLKKYQNKVKEFGPGFEKYFNLHYDEKSQAFILPEERCSVVERELDLAGYFCIVTSEKMSAKEAIELYKSRDVSEKLFRGDKSYLGNKSIRVYSEESARAKIFVEFVAMIVRCKMYIKLKEEMKKLDKKLNYMTVPAAIKELEKIEMVRQLDNIYRLDHAVTANQKVILKAFGLDANSIKYFASELSKELKEAE